jgi:2,4-dienoyl-CoA reductase-like NADH-dependent reductase (Old Yellow Enzyme family)
MTDLFDTTSIKSLTTANRFVRSATGTRFAREDGGVTAKLIRHVVDLAKGGVGLIVSGHAYVLPDGQASPRQLGIYRDAFVPGLTELVNTVHNGGSKIVAQLNHGGAHSPSALTGVEAMGPSIIPVTEGKMAPFPGCRASTKDDIDRVVDAFRQAARRAQDAGFDGIQLHGAHGYLFSEFLSPFYNTRIDKYGGSVQNRARIVIDTYHEVRNEVGDEYPIMIKMNVTDFLDDGLSTEDAFEAAVLYDSAGFDAIELSGGTGWGSRVLGDMNRGPARNVTTEAYYRDMAQRLKQTVQTPIILTGSIKSYDVAAQLVHNNIADYIGLCRPLIREPNLVNRWKSGDTGKSGCVSDNACMFRAPGKDLQCFHLTATTKT